MVDRSSASPSSYPVLLRSPRKRSPNRGQRPLKASALFQNGAEELARAVLNRGGEQVFRCAGTPLSAWAADTDRDLATFVAFIRLWYGGHFIDHLFFGGLREPDIVRGITSLLAGNTTHPDNRFLAMLQRRMHALDAGSDSA